MGFEPTDEQFNPLRLREGRWAARDGEVVLDASTADGHGVEVGDTVQIAALTPSAPFEVVGLGRFGKVSSLGGATMAVFDLPVAQRLLQKEAGSTSSRSPRPTGSRTDELVQRLQPFASRTVQVQTAQERAVGRQGGDQPLRQHHHVDPARLRRRRALRRRLRDRQHDVDHGRPAHPRARDAAPDRRHPQPGAAGRRARVARDRRARIARRRRRRGRARRGPARAARHVRLLVPGHEPRRLALDAARRVRDRCRRDRPRGAASRGAGDADLARRGGARGRHPRAGPHGARRDACSARCCSSLGTGLLALGMLRGGDLGVAGTLVSSLGGMLLLFIGAAMLVPVAVPVVARLVGWPAARFAGIPGTACARQRDPQSRPHRLDGGRADDRDRARLGDRGRRPQPQGQRGRGDRVADRVLARAPVADRLGVAPTRGGPDARRGSRRARAQLGALRPRQDRQEAGRRQRHRPGHDRRAVPVHVEGRQRAERLRPSDDRGARARRPGRAEAPRRRRHDLRPERLGEDDDATSCAA